MSAEVGGIADEGDLAAPTIKWGPDQLFTSDLGWQKGHSWIGKTKGFQRKIRFWGKIPTNFHKRLDWLSGDFSASKLRFPICNMAEKFQEYASTIRTSMILKSKTTSPPGFTLVNAVPSLPTDCQPPEGQYSGLPDHALIAWICFCSSLKSVAACLS